MIISPMQYFSGLLGVFTMLVPTILLKSFSISPEHNGVYEIKVN